MNSQVKRLCDDFAKWNAITLGESSHTAHDRCWELSLAFSWFCKGRNVNSLMLRCEYPIKRFTTTKHCESRLISHYVVKLPDLRTVVDWTARQFWKEADHPLILREEELPCYWGKIGV